MRLSTFTSCNLCLFVAAEQCVCKFYHPGKETCIFNLTLKGSCASSLGNISHLKNRKNSLKMNFMELLPVVMNVKECYTVCFSEMFAQHKQANHSFVTFFFSRVEQTEHELSCF